MRRPTDITQDYLNALGDPSAQGAYALRLLAAVLDTGTIELATVDRFVAAYRARQSGVAGVSLQAEHRQMEFQRQAFLRAWRIWLATHPAAVDIENEIQSTGSAIRQIFELKSA